MSGFFEWLIGAIVAAIANWLLPIWAKAVAAWKWRNEIAKEAEESAKKVAEKIKQAETEKEREDATENAADNSF